jgi:amidase
MPTAEQLVADALDRIARDHTGAVITVCDQALEQAREIDRARDRGMPVGPLAGLPFTAKDVLATAGTRTTAACRPLAHYVPDADAPAVARLRRAGAVLVGKTNCSELALSAWTGNPLFSETRHPHASGRSPGGSSGGCAAAIAGSLVTLSLGTDYGGSVRFPAACCEIVALRPTPGRVDSAGQVPHPPPGSPRARFSLVGPLGRRVQDIAAAFRVLDTTQAQCAATLPKSVAVAGDQPSLARVADRLRRAGLDVAVTDPAWLREAEDTYTKLRALDTFDDLRPIAEQLGDELRELIEAAPTKRDHDAGDRLERLARAHREQALRFLRAHHLLLAPIAHVEIPPSAGQPPDLQALGPCRAITLLDLPALSISGIQVIGAPGRDEEVLALGALIERDANRAPSGVHRDR